MSGGALSDHELIVAPLFARVDAHGDIAFFEFSDDVVELGREYEVAVVLGLVAEEEEKHESL